jgi:hypothetical protein
MDSPRTWFAALLRLWRLQRLAATPPGSAAPTVIALGMLWLAMWVAIDRGERQPNPQFSADGIPLLAWYALGVVGLAGLLRWRCRPAPPFSGVLALATGLVPVPLLLATVAADYLTSPEYLAATVIGAWYLVVYLARGLQALTGQPQRAAAVSGLVFVAAFGWASDRLDVIPDLWSPLDASQMAADAEPDAEALLFEQADRIDEQLAGIRRDAAAASQGFFLGFAGVGGQKVFAQEIGLAQRVLGARYGTGERSVMLINDQRDFDAAPLATVSGLRYALHGLGARMNLEHDVLFLAISSHGSEDGALAVENAQLPLDDLTAEDLADALRDSGIKWRVIIISACYAGTFLEPLENPQTIIITAAAADRSSFGCSDDSDLTYFGEAFYRDALPTARSLREAFQQASAAIAARERRERFTASNPQAYFGAAMEAKLAAINAASPPPRSTIVRVQTFSPSARAIP